MNSCSNKHLWYTASHIWRHDLQTDSTGSTTFRTGRCLGDSRSRCERVDNSTSSWVELCRYKRGL